MNHYRYLPFATTIAVIALILYFSFVVLSPFLYVIATAAIFAIFLNPLYEWLLVRLKNGSRAATVTILLLLVFILMPLFFITGSIVSEARDLYEILRTRPELIGNIENLIVTHTKTIGIPVEMDGFNLQKEAIGALTSLIQNATDTLRYVGALLLNTFFVLITTFFFLTQKKRIQVYLEGAGALSHTHFQKIANRTVELVNGIVRGNVFVVATSVVAGSAGFLIFDVPAPLLLGILYGIFSLIPAVGSLIVWVPVALILLFSQGIGIAVLLAIWFLLSNILIDNVVAPRIIGSQTRLHQLLIMFSVMGGVQQFGLIGLVLGPVAVALAFVAIEMYKELVPRANSRTH